MQKVNWTEVGVAVTAINQAVNSEVHYVPDIMNYKLPEFWADAIRGGGDEGDCEDYAIAKFHRLVAAGIPQDAMDLVICKVKLDHSDLNGHVVLVLHCEDADRVLDNRDPVIWDFGQLSGTYTWVETSIDGNLSSDNWRAISPAESR